MKNKFNRFALFLYFCLTVVPMMLSCGYALLYSFGLAGALHSGFTFSIWIKTFSSQEVLSSLLFSLYVAIVSMILTITGAMLLVSIFRNEFRHGWISTILYFPLAIPAVVAAFVSFQFLSKSGLLARIFYRFGGIENIQQFPDWIHDAFGTGIITTHVLMALPFFVILFLNFSESENLDELTRVARTLGASLIQSEWKIAVPILFQKAFPAIVLYFIFVLGSYEIPLLLGRQFPQMVSVLMIRKLQRFNLLDIPTAFTLALLYVLLTAFVILLLFRKRKLAYDL